MAVNKGSRRPNLTTPPTKAILATDLLVELLNSLDDLVENVDLVHLSNKVKDFDSAALIQMAQKYGSGKARKILKSIIRKELFMPDFVHNDPEFGN